MSTLGKAVSDFLAEAEEIIDQLGGDLVELADCADTGDCNPDLLNSIFRGAHSLKGLAGMFGFSQIQELAHTMENLLDSLRLGKVPLTDAVISVLSDSSELLGSMVRSASGGSMDATGLSEIVTRITACVSTPKAVDGPSPLAFLGLSEAVLTALTEYEEHRLLENLKKGRNIYSVMASFDLTTFDQDLGSLTEMLKSCGEVISTLPSVGSNIELSIDFELLFGSDLEFDQVRELVAATTVAVRQLGSGVAPPPSSHAAVSPSPTILASLSDATPAVISVPSSSPPAAPGGGGDAATAKSMSRTVRVDIGKLDDLMNIVGELVLCHSSISVISERMHRDGLTPLVQELTKAAKGLERKLTELQKGVMEIRMIPVGQLYEKMGRIVRKVAREQGKKVDLKLYGADTELDKLIIEDIADPVMHIIRNAIDHGIEPPEERRRVGKEDAGTIRLSSFQKGNHVVIEVEDDGRGIDTGKVRRKAVEKGLIGSADALSDHEAIELIFLPGFSTSDTVSEISGRGVGMDVVKNNIAAVSGMVDIESVFGKGSRITITLPITLAIIKALIIASAGRTYALPITSVLETIMINREDILTVERKEVIQLREMTLPLLRLGDFFHLPAPDRPSDDMYVVVVGAAEKRLGIIVHDLLGQQDIVIKSLGTILDWVKGISGAADLGDQRTILVLDVAGIINEATRGGG
ncbi:chemotaxis protein CheA [Geobacter argillaceus]|uniref:histidine kinase n=1 Tax=Geobacter argillaceus TaxID=345631 RepID=A0A562W7X3_9BACT|nr:chemotaxis protein CheA [Geobacter argillaceus]TWJ26383.1 CheA signal transduction histidine kinase [Geobacter argillaceus]